MQKTRVTDDAISSDQWTISTCENQNLLIAKAPSMSPELFQEHPSKSLGFKHMHFYVNSEKRLRRPLQWEPGHMWTSQGFQTKSNPKAFFTFGRVTKPTCSISTFRSLTSPQVFEAWWSEARRKGQRRPSPVSAPYYTSVWVGQQAYTAIRVLVVVEEGESFCRAL
jgi:hypothetical protein